MGSDLQPRVGRGQTGAGQFAPSPAADNPPADGLSLGAADSPPEWKRSGGPDKTERVAHLGQAVLVVYRVGRRWFWRAQKGAGEAGWLGAGRERTLAAAQTAAEKACAAADTR